MLLAAALRIIEDIPFKLGTKHNGKEMKIRVCPLSSKQTPSSDRQCRHRGRAPVVVHKIMAQLIVKMAFAVGLFDLVSALETDHSRRVTFGQLLASTFAFQQQQPIYAPAPVTAQPESPFINLNTREYLQKYFPNLLTYNSLVQRVTRVIPPQTKTTLLATSLCCDEVNRGLDRAFEEQCE